MTIENREKEVRRRQEQGPDKTLGEVFREALIKLGKDMKSGDEVRAEMNPETGEIRVLSRNNTKVKIANKETQK